MASRVKIWERKFVFWLNVSILAVIIIIVGLIFVRSNSSGGTNTGIVPTVQINNNAVVYGVSLGSAPRSWSKDKLETAMKQAHDLGVTSIRFDVSWSALQPKDSKHYEWDQFDAVVKTAQSYGLSSLIILDYTPAWARVKTCTNAEQCPPADNNQFAVYATAVVNRYKPMGVNAYEIWNEENSNQFWLPAANAAAYKDLLHATSAAIRQQSPDVTIIMGGTSPAGDPSEAIAPRLFLQQMYALGAKDDFDAVAAHPYTFPFIVGQSQAVNWDLLDTGDMNFRDIMVANGDAAKKIWITEYGAPTGGAGKGTNAQVTSISPGYDHVSVGLQSQIAKAAIASTQTKPWLAGFYWYTLLDGDPKDTSSNESFFGLIDANNNPKPAYTDLQQALSGIREMK